MSTTGTADTGLPVIYSISYKEGDPGYTNSAYWIQEAEEYGIAKKVEEKSDDQVTKFSMRDGGSEWKGEFFVTKGCKSLLTFKHG
jgi:hypothetical protein